MRRLLTIAAFTVLGTLLLPAGTVDAAFSGSEVYLPSVGKGPGAAGSQWYTTMWIHNPGPDLANVQIMLLLRDQANPSPDIYNETIQPGETVRYEDVVGVLFGGEAFGALRIVSSERVVVASRIYSRQPGQAERDSVGQFFAAVPAGFSFGPGQRTSLLGVFQTTPVEGSEYRYNFGFVETAGQPATVEAVAFDGVGDVLGAGEYALAAYEARQVNITDLLPGVDTDNARIEIFHIDGSGRVIAFGSGLANASSDPSTFEMAFDDGLLGGGSGSAVVTDPTLTGDGTPGAPLGIADAGVDTNHLAADAVTSVEILDGAVGPDDLASGSVRKDQIAASGGNANDVLSWNGTNLIWSRAPILPHYGVVTSSTIPAFEIRNEGNNTAIYGRSWSGNGVKGLSTANGAGVLGVSSGFLAGVEGTSFTGPGVSGLNEITQNYAELGAAQSAVYVSAQSGNGVRSVSVDGDGVSARATDPTKSGIFGDHDGGGAAGWFNGDVEVTGNLSKAGGSFKIDHPLDPANRYLQHSFVESPDMMNVYNGNVVLDEHGEAWVELPDWFEALNRDFRYQLTCIGGFSPVYVASKVAGNRFRIAGGQPGLEVSWQITGVRHDPWAEANRIEVELDKTDRERGYYVHPELYGLGEESSVTWIDRSRDDEHED